MRNNTGGLVDPAIKMLDMLLPEGTIATATYRDGSTEVLGTSDASCVELPMVVLTNENTASAAELFTQALRDYGVAQSVGTTTYGKGVMQVTHSLKDGSAIRITVTIHRQAATMTAWASPPTMRSLLLRNSSRPSIPSTRPPIHS